MRSIGDVNRDIKKSIKSMNVGNAIKFAKEREEILKCKKESPNAR